MEIRKGNEGSVRFAIPDGVSTATFVVENDGVALGQPKNAVVTGNIATATVPYSAVFEEGPRLGKLTFMKDNQRYTLEQPFDVVTSYLNEWDLKSMFGDEDLTDEQLWDAEAAARFIINAHTGQTFGKHTATHRLRGSGGNALELPERLIEMSSFNNMPGINQWFDVVGDGWYLKLGPFGIPPVRADFYGLHMHRGGVIHNPNNVSLEGFTSNAIYTIAGTWGWNSVPTKVKEAARLLANDYLSDDSQYRDRYLTSMTAADWRIQFNDGAFTQTGNVRANQLLAEFVLMRGWAVI